MYLVMAVIESVEIVTLGNNIVKLPLIVADGMIGACPVFKYKKDAKKYAGKNGSIREVTAYTKEEL